MSSTKYQDEKDEDVNDPELQDSSTDDSAPVADADPDSPAVADNTPPVSQTPSPDAQTTSPTPQAAVPDQAAQAPQTQAAPGLPNQAAPQTAPVDNKPSATVDVIGHQPPAQNALQGYAEDMAFHQDLNNGQITPETYQSLFAKKDTLGKIGTIFGLLLSGAGSGLAHQPNALLGMMDNQIKNDLEAQKTNQGNKLSWYNAALAHEKNQSDIQLNQAVEDSTRAGTYGKALDNEFKNWTNNTLPNLQHLGATTSSHNAMLLASLQHRQDAINRLAPGPSKDRAQALLDNEIKPAMNAQLIKNREDLANRVSAIHKISPNPLTKVDPNGANAQQPDGSNAGSTISRLPPVYNAERYQLAESQGRVNPMNPNAIPPSQVPEVNNEIKAIGKNRAGLASTQDSFQRLQALKLAGQIPFQNSIQAMGTLGGAAFGSALGALGRGAGAYLGEIIGKGGEEAANVFQRARNIEKESLSQRVGGNSSDAARERLVDSLLPSWNDNDASSAEAWRKMQEHFEGIEANQTPLMNRYQLNTPFPAQEYKSTDQIRKTASGNKNPSRTQQSEQTPPTDWNAVNNQMAQ